MKFSLPLVLGGLAGAYVLTSKPKTAAKSTPKKEAPQKENPYEEFPKDVDVKKNEENIYKYYSKVPVFLKNIPDIFEDLNLNLKLYYDPDSELGNEKSFIFIVPDFAVDAWNYAKSLMINNPEKYSGKTAKDAGIVTKEILLKFASDVYWSEGLIPYIYQSAFYWVWVSVNYLVQIAWGNINNKSQNFVPAGIEP